MPWWDGKHLDEVAFCKWFCEKHKIAHAGAQFYDIDGMLSEDKLAKEILEDVEPFVRSNLAGRVRKILEVLRIKTATEVLPMHEDRIHFKNGTYFLEGGFRQEKEFCANRLPVRFVPDAPKPERWLEFLRQLLHEEDVPTLQEFMGYCLIPTTRAQAMLMLIGSGGEGKSRVGLVMKQILGDNMNVCSVAKLSNNKCCPADQEGKLLMVDDDMDMAALPKTNYIKSIITSESQMDMEKKNEQSFQGLLYVRFLCFGNGALTALHDHSDGFFRRQIILTTKDRPPDRADDPYLAEKLAAEKEGIFLWCLEGLNRLIANNYKFTISKRAEDNIRKIVSDANNVQEFLKSEGYLTFDPESEASTRVLYETYSDWCEDNAEVRLSPKSFAGQMAQYAEAFNLKADNNIYLSKTKRCRGYHGIVVIRSENPFV